MSKYVNGVLTHKVQFIKPEIRSIAVGGSKVTNRRRRLGIIGAGSFINSVILPILLSDLKDIYEIVAGKVVELDVKAISVDNVKVVAKDNILLEKWIHVR